MQHQQVSDVKHFFQFKQKVNYEEPSFGSGPTIRTFNPIKQGRKTLWSFQEVQFDPITQQSFTCEHQDGMSQIIQRQIGVGYASHWSIKRNATSYPVNNRIEKKRKAKGGRRRRDEYHYNKSNIISGSDASSTDNSSNISSKGSSIISSPTKTRQADGTNFTRHAPTSPPASSSTITETPNSVPSNQQQDLYNRMFAALESSITVVLKSGNTIPTQKAKTSTSRSSPRLSISINELLN